MAIWRAARARGAYLFCVYVIGYSTNLFSAAYTVKSASAVPQQVTPVPSAGGAHHHLAINANAPHHGVHSGNGANGGLTSPNGFTGLHSTGLNNGYRSGGHSPVPGGSPNGGNGGNMMSPGVHHHAFGPLPVLIASKSYHNSSILSPAIRSPSPLGCRCATATSVIRSNRHHCNTIVIDDQGHIHPQRRDVDTPEQRTNHQDSPVTHHSTLSVPVS